MLSWSSWSRRRVCYNDFQPFICSCLHQCFLIRVTGETAWEAARPQLVQCISRGSLWHRCTGDARVGSQLHSRPFSHCLKEGAVLIWFFPTTTTSTIRDGKAAFESIPFWFSSRFFLSSHRVRVLVLSCFVACINNIPFTTAFRRYQLYGFSIWLRYMSSR